MRILHVVTLVSPDAAYGGPMKVALNQCRALSALGHDVTLVAAGRGFDGGLPDEFDGVRVRLFPASTAVPGTGFAGLRARGLQRWLRRHLDDFDVVHVHLGRDLVSMPALRTVRRRRRPYVVQPHGMIDVSSNPIARVMDPLWTRPLLRAAPGILCLTPLEHDDLHAVAGPDLALRDLPNAVSGELVEDVEPTQDVLFLARLAPRKRPVTFAEAAALVAPDFPGWTFSVAGPDEGERAGVEAVAARTGAPVVLVGPVSPVDVAARMRAAAVYVLPAVEEPFGLTVIEAMAQERPVVVTTGCGLAPMVRDAEAGLVVDDSVEQLAQAMRTLMADAVLRDRLGSHGREQVLATYALDAAARRLVGYYQEVVA